MNQAADQTYIYCIEVPWWFLPLLLSFLCLAAALLLRGLFSRGKRGSRELRLPQQIPLSGDSPIGGPLFSGWDCRMKISSMVLFMFAVAFLKGLAAALAALVLSMALAAAAKVPLSRAAARLSAVSLFLLMLLVTLPFSTQPAPGDLVLTIDGGLLPGFNLRGLSAALAISAKACAILLLMEPLFFSSPLSEFSNALISLRFPAKGVNILNLAIRYITVVADEASSILMAARARGFRARLTAGGMRTMAGLFAMLFIRSYERTQRLQEAMTLKGFRGSFPRRPLPPLTAMDLVRAGLLLLFAAALHLLDRFSIGGF